jgi:hypothetical protein
MITNLIQVLVTIDGRVEGYMDKPAFLAKYCPEYVLRTEVEEKPIESVKPDPVKPDPVIIVPDKPAAPKITEADLIGERVDSHYNNPIYQGIGQDVRYLKADGKLWPKTTPTNTRSNAKGDWAVPANYVKPEDWYWFRSLVDGAYAIVPYPTDEPAPDWLSKDEPPRATESGKETTDWELDKSTIS